MKPTPPGTSTPRRLLLNAAPEAVARQLRHLPGLIFFDSVGNFPSNAAPPLSIIAARPVEIIKGQGPGFPAGGACGWVDYEGAFTFGIYPEMLVYHHESGDWWEMGQLSRELRKPLKSRNLKLGDWEASLKRKDFMDAVERAQEYIRAGDIYQVNLSRRLRADCEAPDGLFSLYEDLRTASPAPLATYLNLAGREVISSSPETFLKLSGREIESRPIKGTRPRFADPELDSRSASDLQASEKETAELVMITDLLRNDLGKISDFGTVRVTDMLQLEKLQHVHHLVSTVQGTLREEISHLGALSSCLPGGSITGAPKKRATEIITELEPVPRNLYTGVIGYLGFNGESQFNIAIRTLVYEKGQLTYNVGAGIVADSTAEAEFEETEQKATGIRLAISRWS